MWSWHAKEAKSISAIEFESRPRSCFCLQPTPQLFLYFQNKKTERKQLITAISRRVIFENQSSNVKLECKRDEIDTLQLNQNPDQELAFVCRLHSYFQKNKRIEMNRLTTASVRGITFGNQSLIVELACKSCEVGPFRLMNPNPAECLAFACRLHSYSQIFKTKGPIESG